MRVNRWIAGAVGGAVILGGVLVGCSTESERPTRTNTPIGTPTAEKDDKPSRTYTPSRSRNTPSRPSNSSNSSARSKISKFKSDAARCGNQLASVANSSDRNRVNSVLRSCRSILSSFLSWATQPANARILAQSSSDTALVIQARSLINRIDALLY